MKLSATVVLVLGLILSTEGAKCTKKNFPIPKKIRKRLEAFATATSKNEEKLEQRIQSMVRDATTASTCEASTTVFVPDFPGEQCGLSVSQSASYAACCAEPDGTEEAKTHTISFNADSFDGKHVVDRVELDISLVPDEELSCCTGCRLWGDPHGSAFGDTSPSEFKSFIPCDTSSVESVEDGVKQCEHRLKVGEVYRNRCLGLVEGYEHNGFGRCEWLPDTIDNFEPYSQGGACRVAGKTEILAYSQRIPPVALDGGQLERSGARAAKSVVGYEVYALIGDRGAAERYEIRTILEDSKGNSIASSNSNSVFLNSKQNCNGLMDSQGVDALNVISGSVENKRFTTKDSALGFFNIRRRFRTESNSFDTTWELNDSLTQTKLVFMCKGATDPDENGIQAEFANTLSAQALSEIKSKYNTKIETAAVKSYNLGEWDETAKSSRKESHTLINFQMWAPKSIADGTSSGFCVTGEFKEYEEIFGQKSDFQDCAYAVNFRGTEETEMAKDPDCAILLKKSKCMGFVNKKQPGKVGPVYASVMEKCVKNYCMKANLPFDVSPSQCLTDFMDFGYAHGVDLYPLKTAPNEVPGENLSTVPERIEGCEESVTVEMTCGRTTITKVVKEPDFAELGNLSIDVNCKPTSMNVKYESCAGACGVVSSLSVDSTWYRACQQDGKKYVCVKKEPSTDPFR